MKYNYDDNTKLRIVLLLDDSTNEKIINMNKQINSGISHDIDFSDNCIPHVTLISGKLIKKSDFEKVSQIIDENIRTYFNDLVIDFDEIYYSDNGEWVFMGLKDNECLFKFVDALREDLKEYMQISDARHLHITIAKSADLHLKEDTINNFNFPKNFTAKNVAIGLSGKNGVLLNIIEEYLENNKIIK